MRGNLHTWVILLLGVMFVVVGAKGRFGSLWGALVTPQDMIDGDVAQQAIQNAVINTLPAWAQGAQLP